MAAGVRGFDFADEGLCWAGRKSEAWLIDGTATDDSRLLCTLAGCGNIGFVDRELGEAAGDVGEGASNF